MLEGATEIQRLKERVEAAVQVMNLSTLRTAAAVLDVLASRPGDKPAAESS